MNPSLGVYSEIGALRKVMVCRPGLAHQRLTPSNSEELLFDDVLWVEQARTDHYDFCAKMVDRGVEVVDFNDLLAQTHEAPTARAWLLDRKVTGNQVGVSMLAELRAWLDEMPSARLAEHMLGGIAVGELPFKPVGVVAESLGTAGFVLPPLPNSLFTRDTSCWVYGGVTLNPMY